MGAKPRRRPTPKLPERFQAVVSRLLVKEMESLRKTLGLRSNEKAILLRELTELAGWVIRHVKSGHQIEARGSGRRVILRHPALEFAPPLILLDDAEMARLAEILLGAK